VLVSSLGEQHQGIPVFDPIDDRKIADDSLTPGMQTLSAFFADERSIRRYLSAQYDLPEAG